jgi:acetyl esterase/lipase
MAWALRRKAGDRVSLLSPWVDLRVDGASAIQDGVDHSAFDREDLREYAGLYLSGTPATHPDCSPVLAGQRDLAELGRVYLESARNELLHANATLLADRLSHAGVELHRHEEPRAHHGWQLLPDLLPEAKHSIERVAQFITEASTE